MDFPSGEPRRLGLRGQSRPGHRRLCRCTRSRGAWLQGGAGGNRAAFFSPFRSCEALHLWLCQPVQSSRRLEREASRNLEVMWLLGRLVPDDKVIADFRKDNGPAIRKVCVRFVELRAATSSPARWQPSAIFRYFLRQAITKPLLRSRASDT